MFDTDPTELENLKREVAELRALVEILVARANREDKEPTDGK